MNDPSQSITAMLVIHDEIRVAILMVNFQHIFNFPFLSTI